MSNPLVPERHWVTALADRERERLQRIESFDKAVPKFKELLVKALDADIAVYKLEFPDEAVKVSHSENTVTVECSTGQPRTTATLRFQPKVSRISCEYKPDRDNARNWEESMEDTPLGLQWEQRDPEWCAKEFSKRTLAPVLFPAL